MTMHNLIPHSVETKRRHGATCFPAVWTSHISILLTPDNILELNLLTAFMRFCPGGPWNCTEKSKIIISLIYTAPIQ